MGTAGYPAMPLTNGQSGYVIMDATILNTNYNSTWQYQFKVFYLGQTQTGTGGLTGGINVLTIVGFTLGAVILIVLSLGLYFQAGTTLLGVFSATGAFGVNSQGTRLAQTVGFGLLIWIPFWSEFSGWVNSQTLPNGLSILITLVLTGSVFLGFYLLNLVGATAGDTANGKL
jgi:hypothetical protein